MARNNEDKLKSLFDKARSEEPQTSFDEVKSRFETEVNKPNNGSNKGSIKKGLFMSAAIGVLVLTGGIVALIQQTDQAQTQIQTEETVVVQQMDTDSIIATEEQQAVVSTYYETVKQHEELPKIQEDQEIEKVVNKSETTRKEWSEQKKTPVVRKNEEQTFEQTTSFRFPQLTEEEIKANHRQKQKMLKQLAKFDKKKYAYIPSGTVQLGDKKVYIQSFYIQTTEVTNLEYRTFLFDLLIQGKKDEFLEASPDQTRWVKDYPAGYNKPMQEHYFSHPAYNDYPVVAISRKGAEMYCAWLTKETDKEYKHKMKTRLNDLRVPLVEEWMYAAKGGLKDQSYPWEGKYLRDAKGCYLANFQPIKGNFKEDGAFYTATVDSYEPNGFGLYNMAGNVAEMVYHELYRKSPGTKGGSWTSPPQELRIIDGKDRFKGKEDPSVDVGFRPVVTFMNR